MIVFDIVTINGSPVVATNINISRSDTDIRPMWIEADIREWYRLENPHRLPKRLRRTRRK